MLAKNEVMNGFSMYHAKILPSLQSASGGDVFTGATAIAGGTSGIVPAPASGDENNFLRGDGTWASLGGDVVLSTTAMTVDGGLRYNPDTHEIILRQGNHEYIFACSDKKYVGGGNEYAIVHLPFDSSPTYDEHDNVWEASGSPTVGATNAIKGNALQLNGVSYLKCNTPLTFGGQDFTADCHAYIDSRTPNYSALLYSRSTAQFSNARIGEFHFATYGHGLAYVRGDENGDYAEKIISSTVTNALHHYAMVYTQADTTMRIFVDGVCVFIETTFEVPRMERTCFIGANAHELTGYRMYGSIDEFRIMDGVAVWTQNFTPPTEADYV